MIKNLKLTIKNCFLDLLFPKYCVNCGHESELGLLESASGWLCFGCAQKIIPVVSQVCPECGKLSEQGKYHKNCSENKSLKGIICATYFEEGPIREMIHNFKYNGVTELAKPLSDLMVDVLANNFKFQISNFYSNSNDKMFKNLSLKNSIKIENLEFIISFAPLHWKREAVRGYNQAEILATKIGEKLNVKVESLLIKKKSTKRQVELQGNSRRKNLSDVFMLTRGVDIKNKIIIIVDDITTTGSTLNECAKVLKSHGAKEVWGLVVARG